MQEAITAITLHLGYVAPYNWEAMIAFFAARAITGVEVVEPRRYRRTIALNGTCGTIEVAPLTGRGALAATIRFPNQRALPAIIARIRRMFDLDADIGAIEAKLARDRLLACFVHERPGLRVPGAWDGFELAVRAVLGQQISVAAARRLAGKAVATYGQRLPPALADTSAGLTSVFPTADRLARATPIGFGMPRARAAALTAVATAAAAEPHFFECARDLEEAITRLRALPGVGDWTAHYVAMRAMREPDAFPASDLGLLRAAKARGLRPTATVLAKHAEVWRPWRAYAAQHLWASVASGGGTTSLTVAVA